MKEDNSSCVKLFLPLPEEKGGRFSNINKDRLTELFKPMAKTLRDTPVVVETGSSKTMAGMMSTVIGMSSLPALKKEDYVKLYLSFTSSLSNALEISRLDVRIKNLWMRLAEAEQLDEKEVKKILGRNILVEATGYWQDNFFVEPMFDYIGLTAVPKDEYYYYRSKREYDYKFYLSPAIREFVVRRFMGPTAVEAKVVKELPAKLEVENFEPSMGSDFTFLNGMAMTGNLLSSTGNLTAARLKSIKKTFPTGAFLPTGKDFDVDRVEMLVTAFFTFHNSNQKARKPDGGLKEFAKFAVETFGKYLESTLFGMFVPAYQGFTKTWTSGSYAPYVAEIVNRLLAPAAEGWIDLSNLRIRYMCSQPDKIQLRNVMHLFRNDSMRRHTLKLKSTERTRVGGNPEIDWFDDIDFPFVVGWLRFLCGLGIVELAREKSPKASDPLGGIRYARLTPLGRYAFGFDQSYTASGADLTEMLDVDDSTGILTVLRPACPYLMYLQSVCEPLSQTRYRLTPKSLLRNCTSRNEVDARIESLGDIIDLSKHPGILKITEAARQRVGCVVSVANHYRLLRLKPGMEELAGIIAGDRIIREHVILAEGGRMLVEGGFVEELKSICLRHGFLLEL